MYKLIPKKLKLLHWIFLQRYFQKLFLISDESQFEGKMIILSGVVELGFQNDLTSLPLSFTSEEGQPTVRSPSVATTQEGYNQETTWIHQSVDEQICSSCME